MRRLALAITLASILSGVARAGEIPTTGVIAPPPPPTTGTTTNSTANGEMASTGAPQESDTLLTIILAIISIAR
jgi:hypothetical protein